MKPAFILIAVTLLLSACDQMKQQNLKSPCVSVDTHDSPCERIPINTAWHLKQEEHQS